IECVTIRQSQEQLDFWLLLYASDYSPFNEFGFLRDIRLGLPKASYSSTERCRKASCPQNRFQGCVINAS
ncbi:MAG TPA: hypothetical protein VK141_00580, partial [Nitrosomonas sp.]|nr:hypothetical protein [Nitrosomonas sp.]